MLIDAGTSLPRGIGVQRVDVVLDVIESGQRRHAGDGYASLEVELWDMGTATLVAYATQLMIFTFPSEPPPPELRVPRDLR